MDAWFVYDYYTYSGGPKAEAAVMEYAREKYLHCLVADYMLEDVQMDLEVYCMKLREENKRLSSVSITLDKEDAFSRGLPRRLNIGQRHLLLRKVKNVIE